MVKKKNNKTESLKVYYNIPLPSTCSNLCNLTDSVFFTCYLSGFKSRGNCLYASNVVAKRPSKIKSAQCFR